MTLPVKLGVGALTLGSCATAGCLSMVYLRQGTAINKLIDEKFEHILLNTEKTGDKDANYWKINWESYKTESQKHDTDLFGLKNWNKSNPSNLTSALKEKCEELSKTTIYDTNDSLYQKVTTYCARSVTIADHIKKDGLIAIDTSNAEGIWKTRESNKSTIEKHFSILGITPATSNSVTAENIKNGCKATIEKSKKESNYQNIYNAYKEVCVKKNGEQ